MIRIGHQQTVNLLRFFDELPDPRSEVNRLHLLGDVIVTAIRAVVAGADGPTAIAKWACAERNMAEETSETAPRNAREGHVSTRPLVAY